MVDHNSAAASAFDSSIEADTPLDRDESATAIDLPEPGPRAIWFARELKRMTNHQVWSLVQAAIPLSANGQRVDDGDLSYLPLLLEEWRWRLSGLD